MDWSRIYHLTFEEDEDPREHSLQIASSSQSLGQDFAFTIDFAFNYHMIRLEREYSILQYQLAYLSTFGGAYHLLNRPLKALQVAYQQEYVGRRIRSTEIIVRAKVFQGVNWMLLGKKKACHKCFEECKALAQHHDHLKRFISASEGWLIRNHGYNGTNQIENEQTH